MSDVSTIVLQWFLWCLAVGMVLALLFLVLLPPVAAYMIIISASTVLLLSLFVLLIKTFQCFQTPVPITSNRLPSASSQDASQRSTETSSSSASSQDASQRSTETSSSSASSRDVSQRPIETSSSSTSISNASSRSTEASSLDLSSKRKSQVVNTKSPFILRLNNNTDRLAVNAPNALQSTPIVQSQSQHLPVPPLAFNDGINGMVDTAVITFEMSWQARMEAFFNNTGTVNPGKGSVYYNRTQLLKHLRDNLSSIPSSIPSHRKCFQGSFESDHAFVQWLFPMPCCTYNNPLASGADSAGLQYATVDAFFKKHYNDNGYKAKIREHLLLIRDYYGIGIAQHEKGKIKYLCVTLEDHHVPRGTRFICACVYAGLMDEAYALYACYGSNSSKTKEEFQNAIQYVLEHNLNTYVKLSRDPRFFKIYDRGPPITIPVFN
jgi:hypothetical protein